MVYIPYFEQDTALVYTFAELITAQAILCCAALPPHKAVSPMAKAILILRAYFSLDVSPIIFEI